MEIEYGPASKSLCENVPVHCSGFPVALTHNDHTVYPLVERAVQQTADLSPGAEKLAFYAPRRYILGLGSGPCIPGVTPTAYQSSLVETKDAVCRMS